MTGPLEGAALAYLIMGAVSLFVFVTHSVRPTMFQAIVIVFTWPVWVAVVLWYAVGDIWRKLK